MNDFHALQTDLNRSNDLIGSLSMIRTWISKAQAWIKAGYWYSGLFTHFICAFTFVNISTRTHDLFFSITSPKETTHRLHRFFRYGHKTRPPENHGNSIDWRVAVDSELKSGKDEEKLILTMAGHYLLELNSVSYPIDSVSRNFDWVHIRSYDYHTPLTDSFTAGHTPLYDPSSRVNTDYGVNEWIRRGLSTSKLVMSLEYHSIGAKAKGLAITRDGSLSYEYQEIFERLRVYNSTYVINQCAIESFWIGSEELNLTMDNYRHMFCGKKEGAWSSLILSLDDASATYKLIKCMQVALPCV
ncbi:hypothetical protein OSB04_015229 [Centaurea solstitialis]|uniref:GH18 domain-containing protein n=1 Tax=Centaurea solstitialis TaxID=347529 RepID=A0AA38T079_9ASTR|nr:hypothetical protein OSB04_015229 [Centaurea solstitialis]